MSLDLDTVYRRHIVMVRNCAWRITGDRAMAQDVAQDVFVKFMLRRRERGPEEDAPSLLYLMATNAALNHLRKTQHRAQTLRDCMPASLPNTDIAEDKLALRKVLARVPEEEALIATYYYVEGLLQDEIATLTHLERRTVGNRLESFRHNARRVLGVTEAPPASRKRWTWLPIAATVACFLCVAVLRHAPEETRSKGATTDVALAVQRDGKLLFNDVPAGDVAHLQSGDRLRLRVHKQGVHRAKVEGFENNVWVVYYDGNIPSDGWLPMGVALTDGGQTQLRVTLCGPRGRCDAPRILVF